MALERFFAAAVMWADEVHNALSQPLSGRPIDLDDWAPVSSYCGHLLSIAAIAARFGGHETEEEMSHRFDYWRFRIENGCDFRIPWSARAGATLPDIIISNWVSEELANKPTVLSKEQLDHAQYDPLLTFSLLAFFASSAAKHHGELDNTTLDILWGYGQTYLEHSFDINCSNRRFHQLGTIDPLSTEWSFDLPSLPYPSSYLFRFSIEEAALSVNNITCLVEKQSLEFDQFDTISSLIYRREETRRVAA